MIEALRQAFIDRNNSLGDPGFVKNPLPRLLSRDYAAEIRRNIDSDRPPGEVVTAEPEKHETTHYSIVDRNGNAVSVSFELINHPSQGLSAQWHRI